MFGSVLAMATAAAGNKTLTLIVSIFSILFYLYLLYTLVWEVGATDRIAVDTGKRAYRAHTGLVMALVANIPNFIIAIVYTIPYSSMATVEWAGNMAAIARVSSIITEGMYLGVVTAVKVAGQSLQHYWWTYFLMALPAVITAWAGYVLGHKNFRMFAGLVQKKPDSSTKK